MAQQEWTVSPVDVIQRIKAFYGFRFDAEVHRLLDVSGGALSNWKRRGKVNADLIVEACRRPNAQGQYPNFHWLLWGEGPRVAPVSDEQAPLDQRMLDELFDRVRDVVATYDHLRRPSNE
jgi:hypothetical protein